MFDLSGKFVEILCHTPSALYESSSITVQSLGRSYSTYLLPSFLFQKIGTSIPKDKYLYVDGFDMFTTLRVSPDTFNL